MANLLVLKLESVEWGKTKNWLVFRSYITPLDTSRLYTFEFCGSDLIAHASLTDDQENQLREILSERFGYPPYNDLKNIQDKLSEQNYYRVVLTY